MGCDADIVLLNPYKEYVLSAENMFTQAKDICHFLDGVTVSGKPETVILRGKTIFGEGKIVVDPGYGHWLH